MGLFTARDRGFVGVVSYCRGMFERTVNRVCRLGLHLVWPLSCVVGKAGQGTEDGCLEHRLDLVPP
jgi:hypothetical protein